ncbi:MAG TPA: serine/threonine-protein kinase [Anaerolineales bacterium]|nr:serine/threonine-protein kinase [Anaerolineales bacterium]
MPARLKKGSLLAERYEILRVSGSGSFGVVYAARDTMEEHLVAIKEMPMQSIVDCERQAQLRAVLTHPSIPRIFSYFATEENSYLVQQLVLGSDLEAVLEKHFGFLPEKTVLDWGIQICDVLDYLHTHPLHAVIFRDLKPNNVMVDDKGRIYLVDFGLARIFPPRFFERPQPLFEHLRKGLAIGTEGYSPPEQYEGIVLPQSDLYAAGASLHHLLTRRDPRKEPAFSFDETPVRSINPEVSEAFEAIIMKCLERDPQKRYPTADALRSELKALARQLKHDAALQGSAEK